MSTWIIACFTENFIPVTGLSPLLDIGRLSDDVQVVTAGAMVATKPDGYYKYNFAGYDEAEDYAILADGGSSLDAAERYKDNGSAEAGISYILEDTDEAQGKLPTNEIMGSSTKSDKDDEIDAIKDVTDLLPNAGALTDIDAGVNNIEAKLPTNFIMGSSDQNDHDVDIDTILSRVDQSLSATESNIRGVDSDDLKDISDEIAALPTAAGIATVTAVAVWSKSLPGTFGAGEAGYILGTNLDALITSRATQAQILSDATPFPGANIDAAITTRTVPGDAMDLITDALDADALATTALAEFNTYLEVTAGHGAGSWQSATVSPSAVASAVWSEILPGAFGVGEAGYILGTNLDATVSSRSIPGDAMMLTTTALDAAADYVWDENIAGHLGGDKAGQHLEDADATADPAAVAVAVWDALAADHLIPDTMGYLMSTRSSGSPFDPAGLYP